MTWRLHLYAAVISTSLFEVHFQLYSHLVGHKRGEIEFSGAAVVAASSQSDLGQYMTWKLQLYAVYTSHFFISIWSPFSALFPPPGHKRAEIEFSGAAVVAASSQIDLGSCLTIAACHPNNNQIIRGLAGKYYFGQIWQKTNITSDKYDKRQIFRRKNDKRQILLLTNMTKGTTNTNADGFLLASTSGRDSQSEVVTPTMTPLDQYRWSLIAPLAVCDKYDWDSVITWQI